MKTCVRCKMSKPKRAFSPRPDGPKDGLRYHCRACNTKEAKERRKTPEGRVPAMLADAKYRAKNTGVAFTLTKEWLLPKVEAGVCEATGLTFCFNGTHRNKAWSPSLDRINPLMGYTPDNVQVVVWMYNAAKGTATTEDVLTMARALVFNSASA